MPVEMLKVDEIPSSTRKKRSVLLSTPEWKDTTEQMPKLKVQTKGAIRVVLSPKSAKLVKSSAKIFRNLLERHIKENKLPLRIISRGKDEHDNPILYVIHKEAQL